MSTMLRLIFRISKLAAKGKMINCMIGMMKIIFGMNRSRRICLNSFSNKYRNIAYNRILKRFTLKNTSTTAMNDSIPISFKIDTAGSPLIITSFTA